MSDPDDVLPLGKDVVVSSDSDVTKSDITINSSGAEDRPASPPLTTSQRYKKRQRTKKDRQKAVAIVKASKSTKHAPKDSKPKIRNKSSKVWEVFEYVKNESGDMNYFAVKCRLCGIVLSHSSQTTSMRNHIHSKHPYALLTASGVTSSTSPRPGPSGDAASRQRNTMDAYIHNKSKYPRNNSLSKKWDRLAAMYIVRDLRPLDSLDGDGLKAWVESVVPRYSLPSRGYVLYNVMWPMYHGTKDYIKSLLSESESIALTTDAWTSISHQSYISLTAHIIDSEFQLKSFLLSTEHMAVAHTGENLLSHMNKLLEEWGIKNKKVFWVTDNASDIKKAVELGGYDWVGCMGHTVNLAVQKALELPDVNKIIGSAKSIVTYFRQSNNASQQLKESAKEQGFPTLALIQEVDTRWNSAKAMLDRLYEIYPPVVTVLVNNDKLHLIPPDSTRSNMKSLCDFLSDYDSATQLVSGEKYATISLLKPLLRALINHCIVNETQDTSLIKSVKQTVNKDISLRYTKSRTQKILNICTILDPRLKNDDEYGSWKKQVELISATEDFWESSEQSTQTDSEMIPETQSQQGATYSKFAISHVAPPLTEKQRKVKDFKNKIFQINTSNIRQETLNVRVGREVDRYMVEPQEEPDTNPLEWWKSRQNSYPLLTKTFRHYFNIPATSVPSERAFSLCSKVITKKKESLLPENVNIITFLHNNFKYIPELTPIIDNESEGV